MKMQDRKGQIGGTITWFVATIIIIATLLIFIYVSSVIGDARKTIEFGSVLESSEKYKSSMYSSLKTKKDGEIFYEVLVREGLSNENEMILDNTIGISYDFPLSYDVVDLRLAKFIGTKTGIIVDKIKLPENHELRIFYGSV